MCGLCNHLAHPANHCGEVYTIRAGHSTFVIEQIRCACWAEKPR